MLVDSFSLTDLAWGRSSSYHLKSTPILDYDILLLICQLEDQIAVKGDDDNEDVNYDENGEN